MRVPTRSAGTRSGVNCRRLNEPPSTSATVLTVSVLASPGTPSSRTCPPARSATSTRSSMASWPTITCLISKSAASSASWAARAGLCAGGSPSGRSPRRRSSARRRRSSGVTGLALLSGLRDRWLALARGLLRLRAERHREGTPLAAALHHHLDLVAGLVGVHRGREVVGVVDRLARELHDAVAGADARAGRRAAADDVADLSAARLGVRAGHPEVGVLHAP